MDIFNYAYGCSLDDLDDSLMTLQADDTKILEVAASHGFTPEVGVQWFGYIVLKSSP